MVTRTSDANSGARGPPAPIANSDATNATNASASDARVDFLYGIHGDADRDAVNQHLAAA